MKFMYEGKEYEFRGEYQALREQTYFLGQTGLVGYTGNTGHISNKHYAIVHPVEVLHQFGGIEFRETGEVRTGNLEKGEIGLLDTGNVVIAANTIFNKHNVWTILKRVRIL